MPHSTQLFAALAGYVGRPDATGADGIFRRDAAPGAQWRHVMDACAAHYVLVDPRAPEIVLAGTVDGVYRSTDRGASFRRACLAESGRQIWCFAVDAAASGRVWAGASPVGVFLSEDWGESWAALPDPGLPDRLSAPFASRILRLVQHPAEPETLWAALEFGGAMVSRDAGEHWADCGGALAELSKQPHLESRIVSDSTAEGMLDGHALAISPADPEAVVLASRMGLFESRDGGHSWQDKAVGRFSPTTYGRDVRVAPTEPATLYAALSVAAASHDGGVYRSVDRGETWQRFDAVQVHGTIMSIGLHHEDSAQLYIGARYDGEIYGTRDAGESWDEVSISGDVKDVYCVACG